MEQPPRFRWSVEQYEKMIRHGILTENHSVELIRGEIVPKMPKGELHTWSLRVLGRLFAEIAKNDAILSIQGPIYFANSAPEPDLVLLARRDDFYRNKKLEAPDAILIVEVADSSLKYDREVKRPLYAENGIAEYWIVNLIDRCLEVYRQPRPDGTYAESCVLHSGNTVMLALLPSVSVAVAEFIP